LKYGLNDHLHFGDNGYLPDDGNDDNYWLLLRCSYVTSISKLSLFGLESSKVHTYSSWRTCRSMFYILAHFSWSVTSLLCLSCIPAFGQLQDEIDRLVLYMHLAFFIIFCFCAYVMCCPKTWCGATLLWSTTVNYASRKSNGISSRSHII
jgi:hypothetical protein